ncbi:MAG: hypothetical protein A3E87_00495 [Gammaproteobacteria bacterium RIFCSPHIGHO2_12_FULL_35_23]|nr:MAG: hypothetical protein A3E87_00495 [Gammaproteobacteria bacterium RIFCSPHIGHO2_12_FULL_35_23]
MENKLLPALIVGAGPVGLSTACELKQHGIDCRIIDKKPEATQTSNALGVHARSLEMWAGMGIVEQALQQGLKLQGITIYDQAIQPLITLSLEKLLPSAFPYVLSLPQSKTEQLLTQHLASYGLTVERSCSLTSLEQSKDYIIAKIKHTEGSIETINTQWLLGCDGYHSSVRDSLNIQYEGNDLKQEFIMIDAPLTWQKESNKILIFYHPSGITAVFPMVDSSRIIIEVSNDKSFNANISLTYTTFLSILQNRWPFEFSLGKERWMSHFFIHERLANHYRFDRIFLLGDAAHVHSPAGGQGMNTGMQDAYNLTWKLALVIKEQVNPSLLNTYEEERRPIAKKVLNSSNQMTKIAVLRTKIAVVLRNFLAKNVFSNKKLQQKFALQISGIANNYRHSFLSKDYVKNSCLKAGDRAPTIIKNKKFTLLIAEDCLDKEKIIRLIEINYIQLVGWQILSINNEQYTLYQLNKSYCLIRPDQYLASQGSTYEHLKDYLVRFLIQ